MSRMIIIPIFPIFTRTGDTAIQCAGIFYRQQVYGHIAPASFHDTSVCETNVMLHELTHNLMSGFAAADMAERRV